MSSIKASLGLLALGIAMILCSALLNPPTPTPSDLIIKEARETIVYHYLLYKQSSQSSFKDFMPSLENVIANEERNEILEVAALFYAVEGYPTQATEILERMGSDPRQALIRYAFNFEADEVPPPAWQTLIFEDWAGSKLKIATHRKLADSDEVTSSLLQLRHFENQVSRYLLIIQIFNILYFIGLVLVVSLFFMRYRGRSLGKRFFNLTPLSLPLDRLFQFSALILATALVNSWLIGWWSQANQWLAHTLFYAVLIGVALWLVRFQLFQAPLKRIVRVLEIDNLSMQFRNAFQILGGLAILVTTYNLVFLLMNLFQWPFDRILVTQQTRLQLQDAIGGPILILLAAVIGPIFEEILFRGIIFRGLLRRIKPWRAMLVSSLLFTLIHPLPHWPITFATGLALTFIYYRTGNLLVSIWTHALWNCSVLFLATMNFII